ncbi:Polyadenylate-binding protein RBP47B [Forsythia ovata]|uniref:Polyadenylate-binding protein RBP47B n=1 Tax=Forsythia ovata TaxID=205694 RepID=A0ABD1P336_9LAMI
MDESYLQSCFSETGEVVSAKVIRNKHTGQSDRYGFIEFSSHAAAEKVLQGYSDIMMPNTDQTFRLNWAAFSSGDRRADGSSDLSIFVGDLDSEVTDELLHETFASKYPSVKGAKVVVDSNTGRSKCYGFVRFGDENERSRAMTEMNGVYCSSRPMRISVATPKKQATQQQYSSQEDAIQKLNGTVIGKQTVRLSWGRNLGNKQMRTDANNQWNGSYYGRQGYSGNGYFAGAAANGASSNGYGNH